MSDDPKDKDVPPRRDIEDDVLKNDPEDTGLGRKPGKNDLRLPHEREEAPDATAAADGPRQVIEQAGSDLAHGLCDTDRRGVPSDIPGPGPSPEQSTGAEVPPEGVSRTRYARHQRKGADEQDEPGEGREGKQRGVPGVRSST